MTGTFILIYLQNFNSLKITELECVQCALYICQDKSKTIDTILYVEQR